MVDMHGCDPVSLARPQQLRDDGKRQSNTRNISWLQGNQTSFSLLQKHCADDREEESAAMQRRNVGRIHKRQRDEMPAIIYS